MRLLAVMLLCVAATTARATPNRSKPGKATPVQSQPATPAPNQLSYEDGMIALGFFNHFIDVVLATKGDCSAIAASVNMVIDRNRELVRLISEAQAAGKQLPKFVNEKMTERLRLLIPLVSRCASDPDLEAALERMNSRKKQPEPVVE